MRKVLGFTLIFSGTIICIFIFNIILYATVPAYRNVLAGAVGDDADIPVVEAVNDTVVLTEEPTPATAAPESAAKSMEYYGAQADNDTRNAGTDAALINALAESDDAASADADSTKDAPTIVDRTYHEDCGTGEGYWVITYSDGSVGIE